MAPIAEGRLIICNVEEGIALCMALHTEEYGGNVSKYWQKEFQSTDYR